MSGELRQSDHVLARAYGDNSNDEDAFPLWSSSTTMKTSQLTPAVSTWSLHRTLGRFCADDTAFGGGPYLGSSGDGSGVSLIELIPSIARHGYGRLQICHFHLESREATYLKQLREAMATSGVAADMLLIDDGDLTDPDIAGQLTWYRSWLDAAAQLGMTSVRIGAGRQAPTPERLEQSARLLAQLAAEYPGMQIVTENWLATTPNAASLLAVMDAAGPDVGLLIDLGNWKAPEKYADLAAIADRAVSCHAKCHFTEQGPDERDYRQSLEILRAAGFSGTMALIYDGPDPDEWAGLDLEWAIVQTVFGSDHTG